MGTRVLHEYDGAVHRDPCGNRRDLVRDRKLLSVDWHRRGYTAVDLVRRPQVILQEADTTLGRPHRPWRLRPWYAMLRASLLTAAGTARLRARWQLPSPNGQKAA